MCDNVYSSPKKLLVIVVTYNGMKWLDKCLSSVVNSSVRADLFIVDNGSTDGSITFIKKKFPAATLIESNENLGFGKANNLGFKHAFEKNYDFVYLLNQDAWVEPNTFENLISISLKHPDYGILSPLQTNSEMSKLDAEFVKFCPLVLNSDAILGKTLSPIYETSFVMAAHWLIPVTYVREVGGFSPTFYHYGEDVNYIDRMIFHGYKVGMATSCIGVHDREYREISKKKERYLIYCQGLNILSNPNLKHQTLKYLRLFASAIIYGRSLSYFYYFFLSIKNYKRIIRNRKFSCDKSAFLK